MMIYDILAPLIKESEGLRLKAYKDSVGVWTIGWGHTGPEVKEGLIITQLEAEKLLMADMIEAISWAIELCPVLGDVQHVSQLAAIADFVFNLGAGRLRASTLRRYINEGKFDLVPDELRKWVWATNAKTGQKEKLPGLIKRRDAEIVLWSNSHVENRSTARPSV
jgi:lysozyme